MKSSQSRSSNNGRSRLFNAVNGTSSSANSARRSRSSGDIGAESSPFVPAPPARFECDCARCARRLDPLAAVFFGVSFAFALLVCAAGVAWAVQP